MSSGYEALECCTKNIEDMKEGKEITTIVIMDYEMPGISGLEAVLKITELYETASKTVSLRDTETKQSSVTDSLNKGTKFRRPYFAMFSVHKNPSFQNWVTERGVDQVIQKPPNQEEIFSMILRELIDVNR